MMRRVRRIDLGRELLAPDVPKPQPEHECGCGELNAGNIPIKCNVHREQLRAVVEHFQAGMGWERKAIWQEQDGFGKRGFIPDGGYDLFGLTNSSPPAIERMFRVAHGLAPLNGVHTQEGS